LQSFWEQDEYSRPLKGGPGPILKKAAKAARTLNEAVCNLKQGDRRWVNTVVARHPQLSQEARLRAGRQEQLEIEIDELQYTVGLLDQLFSIAIGKSPPLGAGGARLSKRRGTKKGSVKNAAFHHFVHDLLSLVNQFGGMLGLDKNENFHESGGPLADALASLRPYVPEYVIPDEKLGLSTLQRIKAKHKRLAEMARLQNDPGCELHCYKKGGDPLEESLNDTVTRVNKSR
jgi:hypothetical protein